MSDEDLQDFKCLRCGTCCRWEGVVRVTEEEINAIAAYLNIPIQIFISDYTRLCPDRSGLSLTEKEDGSCFFYDEERKSCKINPVKPVQCASFPYRWRFPEWDTLCEAGKKLRAKKK